MREDTLRERLGPGYLAGHEYVCACVRVHPCEGWWSQGPRPIKGSKRGRQATIGWGHMLEGLPISKTVATWGDSSQVFDPQNASIHNFKG